MKQPQNSSPQYWLSLEQWQNAPEFQQLTENEFLSSPLKEADGQDGWARREFLKLMGASLALTSFGCIRRPAQKIVPYAKAPPEIIPGIANFYTSSYVDALEGFGLIVRTREGRPIKVEGNPDHPANRGALSARAQAHVLSLWDPDRLNGPKKNLQNEKKSNRDTVSSDWTQVDAEIVEKLKKGKVAVLTGQVASPSLRAALSDFKSAFGADLFVWEAKGLESSFAHGAVAKPRLENAKFVLTVDCDVLGTYLAPTEFTKKFSAARKPGANMAKLVVFESLMSLTGLNADERFRIQPSAQFTVVMGLLHDVVIRHANKFSADKQLVATLQPFANTAAQLNVPADKWSSVVEQLVAHRGQGVVLAGGMTTQTEHSLALQSAVRWLNHVLDNDANFESGSVPVAGRMTTSRDLENLLNGIAQGRYETVIIAGTNPVYSAPPGFDTIEKLKKTKTLIYVDDRNDETGQYADYVLAATHPLEEWGDIEAQSGVYSLQQPTLRPLYDSRSLLDNLIQWSKKAAKGPARLRDAEDAYSYLRNFWKSEVFPKAKNVKKDFEEAWYDLLQTGFVELKTPPMLGHKAELPTLTKVGRPQTNAGYELVLYMTVGLADGSLSNVSWLQEFPDPVTKICWDNYVCISPKDAKKEGLSEGDTVQLSAADRSVSVPVHIQPGQADGVLGLAVGYGRSRMGKIADGVGVNAYVFSVYKEGQTIYAGLPAKIEKLATKASLACTQGHHSMEGREIVIEATLAQYQKNPSANVHREKIKSIWSEYTYPNHKWGMVIDLNSCTGCSACLVACQSENNVPVVGKRYVLRGREMHWIRVDRYYTGEPSDPQAVFQPLTCQHCDNAPCETVCPVLATVHSDEGTNDMIYNRCVGTRYCSNNCPYKVRRFNWFNYVKTIEKPLHNQLNPEVTVRARGVMEKCTFCTHRIKEAKNKARNENRELRDGDVRTACQETCPADAITFGDLKDKNSAVSRLFDSERNYSLLGELNTKPAVHYLTKIRNTQALKGHES